MLLEVVGGAQSIDAIVANHRRQAVIFEHLQNTHRINVSDFGRKSSIEIGDTLTLAHNISISAGTIANSVLKMDVKAFSSKHTRQILFMSML